MKAKKKLPFQLVTLAFICAMFFPRVIPEGMYFDGLFYANIARDMAFGTGTFWHPHYLVTHLGDSIASYSSFFGHPTLGPWLLSGCYGVFGDYWFVEKGFCVLVWAMTVLLVAKLWLLDVGSTVSTPRRADWWLPIFIWYCMPVVLWSYPYFLLDNVMGVFSLAAAIGLLGRLSVQANGAGKDWRSWVGGYFLPIVFLHFAFLAKGPVGLYPLSIPFIYACVYPKRLPIGRGLRDSVFLGLATGVSLCLWLFYGPARLFWQNYFHTQILSSVGQNEQTVAYSWKDYTLVLQNLGVSALPGIGLGIILWICVKAAGAEMIVAPESRKRAVFYFSVAMSGSLPMLVSHKTSWYYLIPCLPFLAMGFGALFETAVRDLVDGFVLSKEKRRIGKAILWSLCVGVFVYCFSLIGTVGREKDLIHDLKILANVIPKHTNIGFPGSLMGDYTFHNYFERYGEWTLQSANDTLGYRVAFKGDSETHDLHYSKVGVSGLKLFEVYVLKR